MRVIALALAIALLPGLAHVQASAPCTASTCCCTMANGVRCCGASGLCNGGAIAGCPCRNPASG